MTKSVFASAESFGALSAGIKADIQSVINKQE